MVVLQALHGLPDYEASLAVRRDLRWKAACGLGLLDVGFHPSLLTYFRRRLQRSGDPARLFAKVKEVVSATGALAGEAPPGAGTPRSWMMRWRPRTPSPSWSPRSAG